MFQAAFGNSTYPCSFVRSSLYLPVRNVTQTPVLGQPLWRLGSRLLVRYHRRPSFRVVGHMHRAGSAGDSPSTAASDKAVPRWGPSVHIPVLANAVLQVFEGRHVRTFVDGTLGAGGHAALMLAAHPELETLVGIDRDKSALEIASNHLIRQATREEHPRLHFLHGNFCEMAALCRSVSVQQVDGILLDLGVSSMQLDRAERGFSFGGSARARIEATQGGNAFAPWDAPLDMRMDQHAPESLTARHIVNTWSESELFRIFREYGEEPRARQIARRIVEARKRAPIETTGQLATLVLEAKGVRRRIQFRDRKPREDTAAFSTRENSDSDERPSLPVMEQVGVWYRGRQRHQGGGGVLHPATLTFQALRIAVNDELESLRAGLRACLELLRPGGRLVVISFHRLEDRIVKWAFREKVEQRSPSDALEWTASPWSRPRVAVTEQEKRHDDSDDDLVDDFGEQTKALTHFLEALNKPPTGESDAQTSIRAPAGSWRLVTKKPIVPTMEEIRQNPRCRSAKLRVIERESDEV